MTREEKAQIIEELSEKFANHAHFYITDAGGFTVAQINNFRRLCFKNGIEYKVYKNTLIRKALEKQEGTDFSPLFKTLHGFSGVLFSKESGNLPAKVIKEFRLKLVTISEVEEIDEVLNTIVKYYDGYEFAPRKIDIEAMAYNSCD